MIYIMRAFKIHMISKSDMDVCCSVEWWLNMEYCNKFVCNSVPIKLLNCLIKESLLEGIFGGDN